MTDRVRIADLSRCLTMRDDAIPSIADCLLEVGIEYADELADYPAEELQAKTNFSAARLRLLHQILVDECGNGLAHMPEKQP